MTERGQPPTDRLIALYARFKQTKGGSKERRFLRRAIEREQDRRTTHAPSRFVGPSEPIGGRN